MKDPQLYKFSSNEVLFGKKNPKRYLTGVNVNGYSSRRLAHSETWSDDFKPLCDQCTDRTCNTYCTINGDLICTAPQVQDAKEVYFKLHPEDNV